MLGSVLREGDAACFERQAGLYPTRAAVRWTQVSQFMEGNAAIAMQAPERWFKKWQRVAWLPPRSGYRVIW